MTLRQLKKGVRAGQWELIEPGEIKALTPFQKRRITEAVSSARIYLQEPMTAEQLAKFTGVTRERGAQIIRLGVKYMQEAGWLRPVGVSPKRHPRSGPKQP